ncbi:MAG TPA: aldehyde dehydrogenase family protein [Candidatus Krumholzibacteria bacterium]|nr:aldehyde dehydrogenase family protein [Candidatus Krumholzibacteria bacterium]
MDQEHIDAISSDVLQKLHEQRSGGWKRYDTETPRARKFAPYLETTATSGGMPAGTFATVEAAHAAAQEAYRAFQKISLAQRAAIVESVRQTMRKNVEEISRLAVEETGFGRAADKVKKNLLVINKTPGPEILRPEAASGDHGLMITEPAPYGVVAAITPSTNPSETVINNGIGMIAAGNAVVFNAHPGAKRVTKRTLELFNTAVVQAGGPPNLLASCAEPSIETAQQVMQHPGVRLLVVTGGTGVVQAAFKSGKKVIAAGPGNPPAVVDETADIEKAARETVAGASLDNNVICTSEKETLCVAKVVDALLDAMVRAGCYLLTPAQAAELRKHVLVEDRGPGKHGIVNRDLIGKNASVLLARIGVRASDDVRLAIFKAEPDDPLVWTEQLMPIYPVVPVRDVDAAIDLAVQVEHGFGHTASMWSRNIDKLSEMARRINTSIFVKNGPSFAGLGLGGEGPTSFTIASPTGEGLTNARHFSRYRRCTLVDHFRIV